MKKTNLLIMILSLSFLLASCGNKAAEEKSSNSIDNLSLAEIMTKLTDGIEEMPIAENMEVDSEIFPYFTFVDYIEGSECLASEATMSSVAHSVVLLRLPEGSDVEKVRADMEAKADPVKWVCVGAEKVEVISKGNTILLVMSFEDITDKIVENFKNIK